MSFWTQALDLQWRWPWAWALLALPIGLALWQRRRRRQALAYADEALRPWALSTSQPDAGQRLQRALAVLAWLLLVMAVAGPRWPLGPVAEGALAGEGLEARAGVSALVVLQVSDSMRATDVAPDRLTRARLVLTELSTQQRGEQVGLVVYGAQSGVLLPPTRDAALLRDALGWSGDELVSSGRADLAQALTLATLELETTGTDARRPGTVLLVTDGDAEALQGAAGEAVTAALQRLHARGLALQVLLVTAPEALAADAEFAGSGSGFGLPPSDAAAYRALARQGGGRAVSVNDGPEALRRWYQTSLDELTPRTPAPSGPAAQGWRDAFEVPLWLGALLMLLAHTPVWPAHLARAAVWAAHQLPRRALSRLPAGVAVLVLPGLLFGVPDRLQAQSPAPLHAAAEGPDSLSHAARQQLAPASQAFAEQRWSLAQQRYAQAGGYLGHLGAGVAALQLHDGLAAQRHLGLAWTLAATTAQRLDALYNLGLAQARLGRWAAAAQAFGAVLQARPGDTATAHNLRIAEKEAIRQRAGVGGTQDLYGHRGMLAQGKIEPEGTANPEELKLQGGSSVADTAASASGAEAEASSDTTTRPVFVPQTAHLGAGLAKIERLSNPRPRLFKGLMAQDAPRVARAMAAGVQP